MPKPDEFNTAILDAVKQIAAEWPEKGYDINSYFTHNLQYGPDCCLRANHPPKTMCVAAVSEVIVAALTGWYQKSGDKRPFEKLPLRSWLGGTKKDIRGHIFMYDGFASNGTAHALERFGIGRQVAFSGLEPGGFINFNRTRPSGHACIFLSFIDARGNDLVAFGPSVAGFRYFSSQGREPGGFGYRWAFFDGVCPELGGGRKRDCGVIRSDNPKLLCCGHMLAPEHWPAGPAIVSNVMTSMKRELGLPESTSLEHEMAREVGEPKLSLNFDGVTTDD